MSKDRLVSVAPDTLDPHSGTIGQSEVRSLVPCPDHMSIMDIREDYGMKWQIGQAKQRFSEVVRRSATEPQLICNRDRVVAAVIDAETADKLRSILERERQRSIAERFDELRALAKREGYVLKTRRRQNRRHGFADVLEHLPR